MCSWSGKSGLSQLILVYTDLTLDILVYQQVRRSRGHLDSLCMDGAEVAMNCALNIRTRTDKIVVDVLSKLDAALDELLDEDDDTLLGCAKDVNAAKAHTS